jgi:phosphatidate cytidylyltransferase
MGDFISALAQHVGLATNVAWVLATIGLTLLVSLAIRLVWFFYSTATPQERRSRLGSLATWWVLFALLVLIALLGRIAAILLSAIISFVGLCEFGLLVRERLTVARVWWALAYLAVPIHYLILYFGWFGPFWTFIPVWVLLILISRLVVTSQIHGFLETAGITFLGLMLIVFLFSHAVLLLALSDAVNPSAGTFGLLLYLVLLTAVNDIAQALWGRRFGRRKITPVISPNKTWEGFLLGTATTLILGLVLAGFLTPFMDQSIRLGETTWHIPVLPSLGAGVLIAVGGFFGDLTISAIKREVGVKDASALLPGQGGMLDRIDSLTFTAPLFFYFTYIFYC